MDALDPKVFEPYLDASLKCGLTLLQEAKEDQPEVRAVCYGLFSTVAKVSINNLAPYIDIVMQHVLKSLDNSLNVDNGLSLQVLINKYCYFTKLRIFSKQNLNFRKKNSTLIVVMMMMIMMMMSL